MARTSKEAAAALRFLPRLVVPEGRLAAFFEVSTRTIHRWKHEHPEFCHALKVGKEDADARVERSLSPSEEAA